MLRLMATVRGGSRIGKAGGGGGMGKDSGKRGMVNLQCIQRHCVPYFHVFYRLKGGCIGGCREGHAVRTPLISADLGIFHYKFFFS